MSIRVLLGIVCVATLGAQQPAAQAPAKCEKLLTRHLALEVKINGTGPYRLIFDTGSPVVLINSRIAKECNLLKAKPNPAWPGQILLESVEAAGIKIDGVPATVFDHPTIKAIEGVTGPIDGILGHPFFARFATTVDYSVPSITLVPNGHKPTDAIQSLMNKMFANGANKAEVVSPQSQWGMEVTRGTEDTGPGVEITRVEKGSAAQTAGLQAGDRLLSIDGRWTDSIEDCFRTVAELKPNQSYQVVVNRSGRTIDVAITPKPGF